MSTTTARKEKNQQNKFDLNSIRTVMLLYFFTFAAVLIMLIWSLQSFFMTHYFEQMKVQETEHTAALLKNEFLQDDGQFKNLALNASASSDIFIRVDGLHEMKIHFAVTLAVLKFGADELCVANLGLAVDTCNQLSAVELGLLLLHDVVQCSRQSGAASCCAQRGVQMRSVGKQPSSSTVKSASARAKKPSMAASVSLSASI